MNLVFHISNMNLVFHISEDGSEIQVQINKNHVTFTTLITFKLIQATIKIHSRPNVATMRGLCESEREGEYLGQTSPVS